MTHVRTSQHVLIILRVDDQDAHSTKPEKQRKCGEVLVRCLQQHQPIATTTPTPERRRAARLTSEPMGAATTGFFSTGFATTLSLSLSLSLPLSLSFLLFFDLSLEDFFPPRPRSE